MFNGCKYSVVSGDCREITNAFTVLCAKNKIEINISARTLDNILVIFFSYNFSSDDIFTSKICSLVEMVI